MSRFEKFAQHCFGSLTKHLKDFGDKKETEILHHIRVDIKKIKSLLLFANDRVKGFKAHKNYKPFRKIFRRAGEIREPEVISGLLLAHNITGIHHQSIDANSEKLVTKFCEDIPSFIYAVNKQWLKLKPVFKQLTAKDLNQYLNKTKKKIKSKLYPKPHMDVIHKVRKYIKACLYLSKAKGQKKKRLTEFYEKEVECIGQLHDRQVLLNLVTQQNGSDKTVIKKIRLECSELTARISKTASKYYGS